jgi:hypothetical protein
LDVEGKSIVAGVAAAGWWWSGSHDGLWIYEPITRYCTLVLYFEFSLVYLHKTVRIKTRGVGNGGL